MSLRLKLFLTIGMFASLTAVHAASFDCAKASSPTEKMICQNPSISKLDDRLSAAYKEAKKTNPSIVEEQRAWLKKTRECKDEQCLEGLYVTRVQELEGGSKNINQPQALSSSPITPVASPIDILFSQGGFWVSESEINRSNLSCNAILASSDSVIVFMKYDPSAVNIKMRVGGKHPFKNQVGATGNKDIRAPIKIENVKSNGNLIVFDKYDYPSNGAIMGGTYQLDTALKTLKLLRTHTCQNCAESQMRVHKQNQQGSPDLDYWCIS
jgi:uncharacterized protein YecT (DUF1311 family)